jgi:hypothetical protein
VDAGRLARGIIRAFDGATFRASVEIVGSREVVLADVQVSKGLAAAAVTVGASCAVAFLSEHDPKDVVVIAVM